TSRRPARTIAWSSAMTTLIGAGATVGQTLLPRWSQTPGRSKVARCMDVPTVSDEELLASHDLGSFAAFYRTHVDALLGYFCRRTRDPELAADLTAETFAAALAGRRRYRPEAGSASAWLYGIAAKQLAYAQRRAAAERRARRRLGMERIELLDADIERINALGEAVNARAWLERLTPDQ